MGGQVVITLNKQGRDCLRSYLFIQAREIRKQTGTAVLSETHFTDHFVHRFDTVFTSDRVDPNVSTAKT